MIRRPPRSTPLYSSAASDVYKRQAIYRKAWTNAGHEKAGIVTLMLHTFVGPDVDAVRDKVRGPFLEYLKTSTDLISKMRWELTAFAKGDDRKELAAPHMNLAD